MSVSLVELTENNIREVIKLKVSRDQEKEIQNNTRAIALAYVNPNQKIKVINLHEKPIGMILYEKDPKNLRYWIELMMIDKKYQRNGYGKLSLKIFIEDLKHYPECSAIWLASTKYSEKMYENTGFKYTGKIYAGDQKEMKLILND